MGISEMERRTIQLAEQLMLEWLWVFDVDTLCSWINQHCPVRVTREQVTYVLYSEQGKGVLAWQK
jgi:hypothetical protein